MDYILVKTVNGAITPRRLTAEEAEAWYHNQKDCDEPATILDIRHNTMFGSNDPDDLDMLLIVAPDGQQDDWPKALERDPSTVAEPAARALLVFTQWHVDEVTNDAEAEDYARRLLGRLVQYGLRLVRTDTDHSDVPDPTNPTALLSDSQDKLPTRLRKYEPAADGLLSREQLFDRVVPDDAAVYYASVIRLTPRPWIIPEIFQGRRKHWRFRVIQALEKAGYKLSKEERGA